MRRGHNIYAPRHKEAAVLVNQLVRVVRVPLAGWLLFFEEQMSEELHLSDWLNPLICTMVAGFTIVNYTQAGKPFHDAMDSLSGPIYLLFFLYTGVAMDMGVLARNLPAAILIFSTRAILIIISTYLGGGTPLATDRPPRHCAPLRAAARR